MVSGYPDWEGEKSKLYTGADWAAVEAYDVNLTIAGGPVGYGLAATLVYVVPAGQTLYISQVSFACYASVAANADNNQMAVVQILDATTGALLYREGGNGGAGQVFSKPLVIPGGNTLNLIIACLANHNCMLVAHAGGYLI
ncbi:MAG: hypothetical protein HWN68_10945 [Desulfobacterales bacterium]|nr:hypothetical protein [Desulfobacterales bacterium]